MSETESYISIVDLVHACTNGHVTGQEIYEAGSRTVSPVLDGVNSSSEYLPPSGNLAAQPGVSAVEPTPVNLAFLAPPCYIQEIRVLARVGCDDDRQGTSATGRPLRVGASSATTTPLRRQLRDEYQSSETSPLRFDTIKSTSETDLASYIYRPTVDWLVCIYRQYMYS